jgi:ATP/maltotriose-dependent transcriptional regulator MalT
MTPAPRSADQAQDAQAALERGDWEEARDRFRTALAAGEDPALWEGLGWAGWWLADEDLTIDARERAFRAYRAAGDDASAARVAAWLAADLHEFRGEDSLARGWIERATRLLDGREDGEDRGWLAAVAASLAANIEGDADAAARHAELAAHIGREHGVPDLEAIGLAQQGVALAALGRLEDGMRLLDEASALVAAHELRLPISEAWTLCCVIGACDAVGDFVRTARWCREMRTVATRWGGRQMLGVCRTSYGRVLAAGGDWDAAEVELVAAVADLQAARPGMAATGLVRLGELRARQGRTDEARGLFQRAGTPGLVGLGWLALEAGDAREALDLADRVLRQVPERVVLDRIPALELHAAAAITLGDRPSADRAAAELLAGATALDTPYLRARADLTAGTVAAAGGDADAARRHFEDAVDRFDAAAAPYDAARARAELARALATLGRGERALAEATHAREVFLAVGATADARRAETAAAASPAAPAGDGDEAGELSPRELEVLRLVAAGLSDAEIAERLVVSPHTVHRHVANVRTKLRCPSRAAAVAQAARDGLI